jgi:hypothetical protein
LAQLVAVEGDSPRHQTNLECWLKAATGAREWVGGMGCVGGLGWVEGGEGWGMGGGWGGWGGKGGGGRVVRATR